MIIDAQNLVHEDLQNPKELLEKMGKVGIGKCVIYCKYGNFYDNRYTAFVVNNYPDRFIGFAYINPKEDYALEKLEESINNLGLRGIVLNPKDDEYSLGIGGHSLLDPIFSYCSKKNIPIIVYGQGDSVFTLPYQFEEVASSYPKLILIMTDLGMFGGYGDAQEVLRRNHNLFATTGTTTSSEINIALKIARSDKILLGTNTPYECFEVELKKIEIAIPNTFDKKLILGQNIEKILGL